MGRLFSLGEVADVVRDEAVAAELEAAHIGELEPEHGSDLWALQCCKLLVAEALHRVARALGEAA